jgi:hypothetical protein
VGRSSQSLSREAAASVIAAGRTLIEIKAGAKHGERERLFAGHPHAVARPIRVSLGTAERLMKIAAHPVLSKSAHVPILPAAWGTLYELTKVPEERLVSALADGRVSPGMEREDVIALRDRDDAAATLEPEPLEGHADAPQWWADRIRSTCASAAAQGRSLAAMYLEKAAVVSDRHERRALRKQPGELLLEAEELSPSIPPPSAPERHSTPAMASEQRPPRGDSP